jgi:hypothetical protein
LKFSASAPTSSRVRTAVRWLRSPPASTAASFPSCRSGRTICPDSSHAIAKTSTNVPTMIKAPHFRRVVSAA